MKQFILLIFLCFLCTKSFSQCPLFIKSDTDRFTRDVDFLNRNPITLQKGNQKLSILLFKIKGHIVVFEATLINGNIGCFNEDSKVYLLGENNITIAVNYNGKFDCQDNFVAYLVKEFFQNGAGFDFLINTRIKAIRVVGMSGIVDFDINADTSQQIEKVMNCLSQ